MKKVLYLVAMLGIFLNFSYFSEAQGVAVLTAQLNASSPTSRYISVDSRLIEVTRIDLRASGGDVTLTGFYLGTESINGLNNFTDVLLYDASNDEFLGFYPNQSDKPTLVQVSPVVIANGSTKTYYLRINMSDRASGNVRVGISGFTFGSATAPSLVNMPIYGNVMVLPGSASPTPTPVSTPSSSPMPSSTPGLVIGATPISRGFNNLSSFGLKDGDVISAVGSSDPDIYIPNEWGYKRLFLNPIIFGFYGHLGGFANVKTIVPSFRDIMVTSGLVRNCETNDEKVYGIEVTGEDVGILHWVNTSGAQAVVDDPEFFKKVFCINSGEFSWYQKGTDYISVLQVPSYSR